MHLLLAFLLAFLSLFVNAQKSLKNPDHLFLDTVTAYSFDFHFEKVDSFSSYLTVLSDSNVFSYPLNFKTYQIGDTVGSARVIGVGSQTNMHPNGIRANRIYFVTVFSMCGNPGLEEYCRNSISIVQVATKGLDEKTYYESILPSAPNFVGALTDRIANHTTISYADYKNTLLKNVEIRDTIGGKSYVECVYTGERKVFSGSFDWTALGYSREHTFAHSWMPSYPANNPYKTEYSDLFNLYPTNLEKANSIRSNHPFGEVTGKIIDFYLDGKLGYNGSEIVYEPREEQKGNVARSLFYMLVAYNGTNGLSWRVPENQNVDVLMQWHWKDLPDPYEISRQEYIYSVQGNRNPFIDHPEYACYIDFNLLMKSQTCTHLGLYQMETHTNPPLYLVSESLCAKELINELAVYSLSGVKVYSKNDIQMHEKVFIGFLEDGVYVIVGKVNDQQFVLKIVKNSN
jgi:endonuclease I